MGLLMHGIRSGIAYVCTESAIVSMYTPSSMRLIYKYAPNLHTYYHRKYVYTFKYAPNLPQVCAYLCNTSDKRRNMLSHNLQALYVF